jgi:hypothetical protein
MQEFLLFFVAFLLVVLGMQIIADWGGPPNDND